MHIRPYVNLLRSQNTTQKKKQKQYDDWFLRTRLLLLLKQENAIQRNKKEATDATLIPRLEVDVDWLSPCPPLDVEQDTP